MTNRQIVVITVTATVSVFAWGAAMVAADQVAATVVLAPALGVTVQQIVRAARARSAPTTEHRAVPAADQEDDAP